MNGKKWRYRSPENVIAEMIEFKERYNVEEVAFLDDHLIGNRERFIKIMDMMIEKNIKNVYIDGKKPKWYAKRIKKILRDKGISIRKLRTIKNLFWIYKLARLKFFVLLRRN